MLKEAYDLGAELAEDVSRNMRKEAFSLRGAGRALKNVFTKKQPMGELARSRAGAAGEAFGYAPNIAAKRLEKARGMTPELAAAERAAWSPELQAATKDVTQRGATGGYGMAANLAPALIGAGVGGVIGGREGAMAGAGLGIGARLGAGGLLRSAREARGIHRTMGRQGAADLSKLWSSPQASSAALGAGALGIAGGAGGYAAGRATEKKEAPWYNPIGLTPDDVGRLAAPILQSQRLGLDPSVAQYWSQNVGQRLGLQAPQVGV